MIDIHLHIAGDGAAGTGCFVHPGRLKSVGFRLILRSLGLAAHERNDLDRALQRRLFAHLDGASSLEHAVVLAMDWTHDAHGTPLPDATDLHVPNDYVLELAARHPKILPGASIHPYRRDALDALCRNAEAGAVLVKWLPVSQNIDPASPRCRPFYQALARLGLPLLCHTGSEGATREINPAWNDPAVLRPALEEGVTVIAAHAGMRSLPHEPDYFRAWRALLERYPNLYGDTAAWFGLRAWGVGRITTDPLSVSRLVHGSDWPVPQSPWWFLLRLGWRETRRLARGKSALERDLRTKRALGLPEEVFGRARELLPLPGK